MIYSLHLELYFNHKRVSLEEIYEKAMSRSRGRMTAEDIRHMSEDDLLDMNYFVNEDELNDNFGEEGFLYLLNPILSYHHVQAESVEHMLDRFCLFLYSKNRNFSSCNFNFDFNIALLRASLISSFSYGEIAHTTITMGRVSGYATSE